MIGRYVHNTVSEVEPTNEMLEPLRVLVVDDSRLQRKLVSVRLKKWGFTIFEAASGKEAMAICENEDLDMILSDWVMPEMSGLEFCEAFRAMQRERYGYFILLTSKSDKEDIAKGLDKGADDFLSKPVNATELRARIKAGQRVLEMETRLQVENDRANAALEKLRLINEEINKDLAQAEKLQKSLLPPTHLVRDTYTLSNIFKSSGHVGGDIVGTFNLDENRIAIYSLDVSGHGVSSALLTVQLFGLLSPFSKDNNVAFRSDGSGGFAILDPHEIAAEFNRRMLDEMDTDLYFTLGYADINVSNGHVKMVQAGHPFPVIFNEKHGVTLKGDGGPPIGLIPGIEFETFTFTIRPDDKLLLHSDGLTECQNLTGDLLDDEGLERILLRHADSHGPELLNDIVWELTEFAECNEYGDDLSAILFEFTEKN
jgi:sigma-B regulation protein RsbU (phosphoserine phosphatase)